ncbi:hypothetical protein AK812_SmicGene16411 [Symbiodinium microadriaticum]|uniref:Uncharacterized protein n=1 Tax=Symbiodinium microadriaticum TaxID=2951 RepID=A0A1Q9E0F3_SYMMI|nr:hypothetical protein AK812_SmicGene16411 [Symbiodinium microadriaticum]
MKANAPCQSMAIVWEDVESRQCFGTRGSVWEDEDEDEDELDDPVPNPRRSWRCASAGKSEGVGGARRTPAPTAKRAARGAAKPKAKEAPSSEKPETTEKLELSEKPEKKSGRRSRRSDSRGGTLPPPPPPPPPRPERQDLDPTPEQGRLVPLSSKPYLG